MMGSEWVSKALRNVQDFVSVEEPFTIILCPNSYSSFCQLMDSFLAKCFDVVPYVDPFLQFAG